MVTEREISTAQQMEVFNKALEIFISRSAMRGDVWANFDEKDALHHMKSKLARLEAGLLIKDEVKAGSLSPLEFTEELKDAILDDAHDLINYAAFFIRHLTGAKPDTTPRVTPA